MDVLPKCCIVFYTPCITNNGKQVTHDFFKFCRIELVSLPAEVLVYIFRFLGIEELLTRVNRTCTVFNELIKKSSILWERFEFEDLTEPLNIKKDDLSFILKHSAAFRTFILPPSSVFCKSYEIDYLFSTLLHSKSLYWLTLTDLPISTLCFITYTPNIEVLNLTGCTNLVDNDFLILQNATKLDQIYLSFTSVQPTTVCKIVKGKNLTVIDVCGVQFTISQCREVLQHCRDTLLYFHLTLDDSVSESDFNREIIDLNFDTNIHLYRK